MKKHNLESGSNPLTPKDRSKIKKDANDLEKWLADFLDGRRIPASGAIACMKGDLEWSEYLVDSKNTIKNTIPLKTGDLKKIFREARQANRTGHLILTFIKTNEHWAVVPEIDCYFETHQSTITTEKASTKISQSQLKTLCRKALKEKKIPAVCVTFSKMTLGTPRKWIIIPLEHYKKLFEEPNG